MDENILLLTDSYKVSHYRQYPPNTTGVYSYFESRGGRWSEVVFFGLQYFLQEYLEGPVVTRARIDHAEEILRDHFGQNASSRHGPLFTRSKWEYLVDRHDGRLPVVIRALPEGTVSPNLNALISIENTDPECYWLTNYLESLLVQTWYPCTVATQSREMKKTILANLQATGDPDAIDFKLHDFGFRGVSSVESAGLGGAAHLVNFKGTDTLAALAVVKRHYDGQVGRHDVVGTSIPASEHSTITSWGCEGELRAFRNMLEQFPTGLVACVSDSYDIYAACREYWGTQLRDEILQRDGTLLVRPDSGEPTEVLPAILSILGEKLGYEKNHKGYKVLDRHVRVIQGDGIDCDSLGRILDTLKDRGWSGDNITFGSGGGLLQKLNRDTLKFAFKCSSATVDGRDRDVFKQPVTDTGKVSKAGKLKVIVTPDGMRTVRADQMGADATREVFRDGRLTARDAFDDVRRRARL